MAFSALQPAAQSGCAFPLPDGIVRAVFVLEHQTEHPMQ
jgi:hypothetical protein